MAGDYALSTKLVNYLTKQQRPDGDTGTSSDADAWVAVQALCGGFHFAEASLGPRVLAQHEPAPETSAILAQALNSVSCGDESHGGFLATDTRVPSGSGNRTGLRTPPAELAAGRSEPDDAVFPFGLSGICRTSMRLILPPATLLELKRMCLQRSKWKRFTFDDNCVGARDLRFCAGVADASDGSGSSDGRIDSAFTLGWAASWVARRSRRRPEGGGRAQGSALRSL